MITLRLSLVTTGEESVVEVEAPDGTTWADLRTALRPWGVDDRTLVEGLVVADDVLVGLPPVLDGARLHAPHDDPGFARSSPSPGALDLVTAVGANQGRREVLTPGTHEIGRSHPTVGDDPLVSRRHLLVTCGKGEVTVTDLHSTGGTTLEGHLLPPGVATAWTVGQHLRLGDTVLRLDEPTAASAPGPVEPDGAGRVHRARGLHHDTLAAMTLDWPAHPPDRPSTGVRWVALIVPLPVALGLALWLRNPALLGFMLLGPVMMLATAWDDRRRGRVASRRTRVQVQRDRERIRRRFGEALDAERRERHAVHPGPDELLAIATGHQPLPPRDPRRPGALRLGHGTSSSRHTLRAGDQALRLTVEEAPVAVELEPGCLHLRTVDDTETAAVMELVVAQLAVLGVPENSRVSLVASPELVTRRWCWVAGSTLPTAAALPESTADDTPTPGPVKRRFTQVHVVDARTPGAMHHVETLPDQDTCVVWVGVRPPPVQADEVTLVRGHLLASGPNGEEFTQDTPDAGWFPEVTRHALRWHPDVTHPAAPRAERGPARVTPQDVGLPTDHLTWSAEPALSVPLGLGDDGEVVRLDLTRSGPHALVAGTTGSGKSELLLAYLHALITTNSPQHVTALLIDYKGGATFGALARAPHVVGVVSDLDDGLAERALVALRAEIIRRERCLAERGHTSYAHAAAAGAVADLPRLFVVVDEFRILAEDLPDFVAGLVRLAAVGRSLGLHLVLATQRPGGIVTADMRANLDARIALRVRDRADSIDVLESPLAARIPRDRPGRACLVVGGEAPVMLQSTYVSGPADVVDRTPQIRVLFGTSPERPSGATTPVEGPTEIEAAVRRAREAAVTLPPPHRPLLPPLPDLLPAPGVVEDVTGAGRVITWSDLTTPRPTPSLGRTAHPLACADLPHAQAWADVGIPDTGHVGISGAPRSGSTTAAIGFAQAALEDHRQVWWIGDDRPRPLTGVNRFVKADDPHQIVSVMDALGQDQPSTLVVIDGWEALSSTLMGINHGLGTEAMIDLLRTAHARGINLVVTGARSVLSSRLAPLLDVRLVMRQNDPGEYSLAGLRPRQISHHLPPGRALVLPHGHEVHFYLPAESEPMWQP